MPITSAARRASLASSIVQQPRAPERYDAGLRESARWMPVTSWPASCARAAATAESTPPDMAATTLTRGPRSARNEMSTRRGCASLRASPPGALDGGADGLGERVDVGRGGGAAEGEAQGVAGALHVAAHGQQHVGRLGHAGRAR